MLLRGNKYRGNTAPKCDSNFMNWPVDSKVEWPRKQCLPSTTERGGQSNIPGFTPRHDAALHIRLTGQQDARRLSIHTSSHLDTGRAATGATLNLPASRPLDCADINYHHHVGPLSVSGAVMDSELAASRMAAEADQRARHRRAAPGSDTETCRLHHGWQPPICKDAQDGDDRGP